MTSPTEAEKLKETEAKLASMKPPKPATSFLTPATFVEGLAVFTASVFLPEVLEAVLFEVAVSAVVGVFSETGKALGLISASDTKLEFAASPDIVAASQLALDTLIAAAPVKSGKFKRSFYIVTDGVFFPLGSSVADAVTDRAKMVVIGNTQPQDRRVDVQLIGSRPLKFSVPAGMYQDAVDAVNRQYGNTTEAKRLEDFKDFSGRYVPKHQGYQFQTPAVQITARG